MLDALIPMVIMTTMFAMIFGIVYIRSRENMAMIEKGLNPRLKDTSPRPFLNLKWGLLLMGSGAGLLLAYIVDRTVLPHNKNAEQSSITIRESETGKQTVTVNDSTRNGADSAHKNKVVSVGADDDDIIRNGDVVKIRSHRSENEAIYFALIAIGGGLGLFLSYRIEKREWLDKVKS